MQYLIFPSVPGLSSLKFIVSKAASGMGSSHELGLKSNQVMVSYSHKCCGTSYLAYLAYEILLKIKEFASGFMFAALLW